MANASLTYREIRYIIHDHSVEVYVWIEAGGDCPLGVQGWHYKHFVDGVIDDPTDIVPGRLQTNGQWSADHINVGNSVLWPQQAPKNNEPS